MSPAAGVLLSSLSRRCRRSVWTATRCCLQAKATRTGRRKWTGRRRRRPWLALWLHSIHRRECCSGAASFQYVRISKLLPVLGQTASGNKLAYPRPYLPDHLCHLGLGSRPVHPTLRELTLQPSLTIPEPCHSPFRNIESVMPALCSPSSCKCLNSSVSQLPV